MITSATMHIDRMALTWKIGKPKWNGVLTPNHACSPTLLKSASPNGIATSVPSTRPSRIDSRANGPGANRSISRMMIKVSAAKARLIGAPKSSDPAPPPAQPAATGISDRPMIKITVPVTSGGKNFSSFAKTGASNIMNRPEAITDP